jgi:VWFA-related protein
VAASQDTTFHAQSNVVLIPALVKDSRGRAVYGLEAKDFAVEDDGVAQPIQMDEAAEAEPISLMVVIQCGRQAVREFPRMKGLKSMIQPILDQESTEAAVVVFDSEFHLTQDFTDNDKLVNQAIQNLPAGDNGAAILDAVNYAVLALNNQPAGRQRVLLLISETRDHGSHIAKLDDVLTAVGQSNTVVYTLAFSPALSNVLDTGRGSNQEDMHEGPDLLAPLILLRQGLRKNTPKAIAAMTGGEYELFDSRKGFETRLNDFTNHLHSRYLLSFQPQDPHSGLHQLHVRLRDPAKGEILARSSYWAQGTAK